MASRMVLSLAATVVAAVAAAFPAAGGDWHDEMWVRPVEIAQGVTLRAHALDKPRLAKVYVTRVELAAPGIGFTATERSPKWGEPIVDPKRGRFRCETERETTFDFMARRRREGRNIVLAVNTTPWGPFPGADDTDSRDPAGLVVADGVEVSSPKEDEALFIIRKDGTAEISSIAPPLAETAFAISGFGLIMTNGIDCATSWSARDEAQQGFPPRTAFGLTADRKTLVILTVDGRQPGYSEGATLGDLRAIFRREGVTDAMNMDGGGSTSLVVWDEAAGRQEMLNHHSNGSRRKNAVNFGITSEGRAPVAARALESGFHSPPASAKPHTYYILMNGNVTKEGITRDFEEMAKAGVGGVQMFDKGGNVPPGPLDFNTPEWFELLRHAASEAKRLGLDMCIANCSGWSSSGGPWNAPSNSMKRIVSSETAVKGPMPGWRAALPRETKYNGWYEDIAVLAFPVPPAENAAFPDVAATVGGGSGMLASPRPFTVQGFSYRLSFPDVWTTAAKVKIEVSGDGENFRELETFTTHLSILGVPDRSLRYHPFAKRTTARAIRFSVEAECPVAIEELKPELKLRLSDLEAKKFDVRRYGSMRLFDDPEEHAASVVRCRLACDGAVAAPGQAIDKARIVDLTSRLSPDGTLAWDVPPGDWTILRFGAISNGKTNHPASPTGKGLEVDKLSASALDWHFSQYAGRVCEELGALAGDAESGLNGILVDSYEVGTQNWTQGFAKEFAARRGYSLIPWLPALTGRAVGSVDETERFLEDFRRTIANLFTENYSGHLAQLCHDKGLKLAMEPYGNCPADNYEYGAAADIPMAEFWSNVREGDHGVSTGCAKFAASLAHFWGRRYAAAESFSARPDRGGRWLTTPFSIKAQCDRVYSLGINRVIYHRAVHQPWADDRYLPGMMMGRWGIHFDRTQTWWPLAGAWLGYQSRCQWMLQEGEYAADVLFSAGEKVPNQTDFLDDAEARAMELPHGYSYDVCAASALGRLKVADGRIVAPGGVSYALLALPPHETMSLATLEKIESLVDAGAKVCAPVRPSRSPGLAGWPQADGRVRAEAARIWAKGVMECTAAEALARLGIAPDFASEKKDATFIHRRSADADWYFVALNNVAPETFEVSFRVTGRVPEIWDAEDGSIREARNWRVENGRTILSLDFKPSGSAFVVFRKEGTEETKGTEETCRDKTGVPVSGPWRVSFPVDWYSGGTNVKEVVWDSLKDWTQDADPAIKYFSGTATYRIKIGRSQYAPGRRIFLNLGEVKNFAVVSVNGREYPPLWRPPYALEITDAVNRPSVAYVNSPDAKAGVVDISIRVTNLWPNRLIGDEKEFGASGDISWKKPSPIPDIGQEILEIPQWVKDGKPSPSGRHTFITWKHWTADDALLPSGLIGPVAIRQ